MSTIKLTELPDVYAFADPSGGKDKLKKLSARSAICVGAQDWLGRIFIYEAWAARCSTDKFIDRILDVCAGNIPGLPLGMRVRSFGIEANAMQSLFVDTLIREARLKGIPCPIQPIYQPTHIEKHFRIRQAIQPVIAFGRLFLRNGLTDLNHELTVYPLGSTVDLADALASLIRMIPPRPNRVQRSDEREQLATYLRNSGVAPNTIEQRMADYDRPQQRNPMEDYYNQQRRFS